MARYLVLITGVNRGIDRGLLEHYLAWPNHMVIAAVSDPSHATTKELLTLPAANSTSLVVMKLDPTVTTEDIQQHISGNVYEFVLLFHAFIPLLKMAKYPKWATVGSSSALLTAIHTEELWLTALPVDLGWVQTDLGQRGAYAFGLKKAAISLDESVCGIINIIDVANREIHSGELWV
ncbi:hypothetical protein C7999DRAFT_41221 [Corynascus novoguineensis]|uniref:Uncharacterized protein n=1 Tax=Corynascus novoguineensis TaxID=1126955 RepID=A0AAN7CT55_9PEZI|nr:hypothetical protein C7999DRAFT_41221 [Corynascus novoguineensis]